ncbi:MAG: DoxX family protein [bacterium]|nr:DoxX family protein [bacterium]
MKRALKIAHWSVTVLACIIFTLSALTYFFRHDDVSETFEINFGFPAWLVYPMAVAKIGGVILLLTKFNRSLTEWAYAGFTFMMLLAIGVHAMNRESQIFAPILALTLVIMSYFTWKRMKRVVAND